MSKKSLFPNIPEAIREISKAIKGWFKSLPWLMIPLYIFFVFYINILIYDLVGFDTPLFIIITIVFNYKFVIKPIYRNIRAGKLRDWVTSLPDWGKLLFWLAVLVVTLPIVGPLYYILVVFILESLWAIDEGKDLGMLFWGAVKLILSFIIVLGPPSIIYEIFIDKIKRDKNG